MNETALLSTLLLGRDDDVLNGNRKRETTCTKESKVMISSDESPTLLELMMTAQIEAHQEKIVASRLQEKAFGGGFKKGFMNNKPNSSNLLTKAAMKSSTATSSSSSHDDSRNHLADEASELVTITATPGSHAPIIDEVQSAMIADDTPFLRHLKKGGTYIIYDKNYDSIIIYTNLCQHIIKYR